MVRVGRCHGIAINAIANGMGVAPDLLARWQRVHDAACVQRRRGDVEPSRLGRPPLPEPPELLREMRHLCHLFGPGMGARDLARDFPQASWRTCLSVTYRCRLELRDQLRDSHARACVWTAPGTVWAADIWQPDAPIEGGFRYILDVRDLATGYMVASEPLERPEADRVGDVFDRLYRQCGAPLVCKTDNGSEFIGAGAWEVHHRHGVEQLLSPVELPSYNGACEAGHGSIRYRAELLARRDGRPGDWSLNHLAGARDWANDLVDARRPVSPRQRFEGRQAITPARRLAFRQAVLANKERRCADLRRQPAGHLLTIASPTITRPAIAAALRDHGLLTHQSVPIRQPISHLKSASISL